MTNLPPVTYQGSVKNLRSLDDERVVFEFTDHYSIFDWGRMPDKIPGKGDAQGEIAALFFKLISMGDLWSKVVTTIPTPLRNKSVDDYLLQNGIPHHFVSYWDTSEQEKSSLIVNEVKVLVPKKRIFEEKEIYDYSLYQERIERSLVPLEAIFRWGTPKGSSFLKRYNKDPNYFRFKGFSRTPNEDDLFTEPFIEFSTKLESTDRYLDDWEAKDIAYLSKSEWKRFKTLNIYMAYFLKYVFSITGIELWDGKLEWAFNSRCPLGFELVDSIGPDELRLTLGKKILSKEFLRAPYRETRWYRELEKVRAKSKALNLQNWKKLYDDEGYDYPEPLSLELLKEASLRYQLVRDKIAFFYENSKPKLERECSI